MMKRLMTSTLVLFLMLTANAASGAIDLSEVSWTVTGLDHLRARGDSLRCLGEFEGARETAAEILGRAPGDGFALRVFALAALDGGELAGTAALLERGEEPEWLDGLELEKPDRAFLLGLIQYYRGRYGSARGLFESAMKDRPGWGWPAYYLARTMEEMLLPWDQCEDMYREALTDRSAAPAILEHFIYRSYPHRLSELRGSALERIRALPAVPWCDDEAFHLYLEELRGMEQQTPEEAAKRWTYLRESAPVGLVDNLYHLADILTDDLTPDGFDEFLRRIDPAGYEGELVDIARAERLLDEDRVMEALSLLDSLSLSPKQVLHRRQRACFNMGSPREMLESSFVALEESADYGTVFFSKWVVYSTGDGSLDSLLTEARRENPAVDMRMRLNELEVRDTHAAAALIDSLLQAGVEISDFLYHRIWTEELRGNGDEVEIILERLPRGSRAGYCLGAASGAVARGDRARAVELIRRSFGLFPRSASLISRCLDAAFEAGDSGLVEDLLDALNAACPGCAHTVNQRLAALMWLNRSEEAAELLARSAKAGDLSPKMCSILVSPALSLGERDMADSLLSRAKRAAPSATLVRSAEAEMLLRGGETGKAREILEGLVADFPADEGYRARLLSAGGSVQQAELPDDSGSDAAFDVFGHDLDSTGWILERAERADTMSGADAAYLLKRVSCVADGVDRAVERNRETIYLRTETAVDIFQPYEISFNAADALPRVRTARVIRRDGKVIDVPGTEIMVKAGKGTSSDVDDTRTLVIPFPGLEPGSVIDLVFDRDITSWYTIGWSRRYLLPELFHVFEAIVELAYAPGRTLHTKVSGDVPEVVESEAEGRILRTWRIEDIDPVVLEARSPNLYEIFPWIGISTHESLQASLEMYRTDFWARIEESDAIEEKVREIAGGARGRRARFDAIFSHVVENVRYVAIELREGRIIPSKPSDVMERGYGDCKDMVALLISLLAAAEIEAEPFLVTAGGGAGPVEGFPEPFLHDHVIVHVPALDGLYADPTSQDRCALPVPASLAGAEGIALPREGRIERARIPGDAPGDHGFSLEADLRFVPGNRARIEVRGVYRGELADEARRAMARPDSTDRAAFVKENLGYGLWENCRMIEWELVEEDCAEVVLEAVFEDSAWAEGSVHSVSFPWRTEVADPVFFYPSPSDREQPFVIPFPFECGAVIRLHDSPLWEAKVPIPVKVSGEGYEGSMSSERRVESGASRIEITQRFRMERSRFERDAYEEFWNDWVRFVAGVFQNYTYRRTLDREELERIENYVRANPGDAGFALQAALQVLGDDSGGEGEAGRKRRKAVRDMVGRHLGNEAAGSWPGLILASVNMTDGRYRRADSLITTALEIEPGNQVAQLLALAIKGELGLLDESIDLHRSILQRSANKAYEVSLIALLQEAGRAEEVEAAVSRYRLLYGEADSLAIRQALVQGAIEGYRCDEADSIFAFMRPGMEEMDRRNYESMIELCRDDFEDAVVLLEEIWEEQPFNEVVCNNLAWCYTLLGRDLDRAEELTELAVLASSGNTAYRNTLATIYARRGEWDRALPIYVELRDTDDRPQSFDSNEFFVGLCDYQMGRKEQALQRWRRIAGMRRDHDAAQWSAEALRLHEEGESVLGAIFENLELE